MCHTPHGAYADYPLWNRIQTKPVYSLYNSISFDMEHTTGDNVRAPSSLCLVCHNGVASQIVNYPGPCSEPDGAYDLQIAGCADLSNDLTDDHPVSFNYVSTMDADNDGFPTTVTMGSGGRLAIGGNLANYPLYGDTVSQYNWFECATCHAVHDTAVPAYPGKGDYQVYFLRADNTGSGMCLDCHKNR